MGLKEQIEQRDKMAEDLYIPNQWPVDRRSYDSEYMDELSVAREKQTQTNNKLPF